MLCVACHFAQGNALAGGIDLSAPRAMKVQPETRITSSMTTEHENFRSRDSADEINDLALVATPGTEGGGREIDAMSAERRFKLFVLLLQIFRVPK